MVARRLLGCELERQLSDGSTLGGRIIETEAYDQTDPASHSYRGETPRTKAMFGPPGHAYIYFTYGMHYCCNVVCGAEGQGAGVLIRALEPLDGLALMREHRHQVADSQLTNGPAKLCQALAIDKALYGHDLRHAPLRLIERPELAARLITQTTRIGIKTATDVPWRFYVTGSACISQRS